MNLENGEKFAITMNRDTEKRDNKQVNITDYYCLVRFEQGRFDDDFLLRVKNRENNIGSKVSHSHSIFPRYSI